MQTDNFGRLRKPPKIANTYPILVQMESLDVEFILFFQRPEAQPKIGQFRKFNLVSPIAKSPKSATFGNQASSQLKVVFIRGLFHRYPLG